MSKAEAFELRQMNVILMDPIVVDSMMRESLILISCTVIGSVALSLLKELLKIELAKSLGKDFKE